MDKHLSPNMEMYLKTILRLGVDGEPVRVKAIAESLRVTMPSVSGALGSLKSKGLVLHDTYGAVRLSSRGYRAASEVNHRFEALKRFLHDVLGVDEETAARDACEIEHVVGKETLTRLDSFLSFMTRCGKDVHSVISHFHEYLSLRDAGDFCHECELGKTPQSADTDRAV
ncbi:MAG TPA: metal-dependent transcriptional regulator [candidate division Zixibacteria bacterium]|jgi:Mn-dependent DtxR family transcriptional regulator